MKSKKRWMAAVVLTAIWSLMSVYTAWADDGVLDAPEDAKWSQTVNTKAVWDKVDDATGYQLRLYFHGNHINTIHSDRTSMDLAEYMTHEGTYSYEVRAVAEYKNGIKYRESSEYAESTTQIIEDLGDTEGRWKNYHAGKKYQREDGSIVAGQWYKIFAKWYYFDEEGYRTVGWKQLGDHWYYFNEEGVMQTGWQVIGENTYCLNEEGQMQTGWIQEAPNQWRYLHADGSMAVDTVVDGYSVNEMGLWIP